MPALSIGEFVKQVKMEKIDVLENTHLILDEIKSSNEEFSHFNLIAEEFALQQANEIEAEIKTGRHRGRLLGVPISVKDCVCVKGIESKAGSKILSGYKPTFDATVIERLKVEGAIIIGKTSQDEFGFGSFSVNTGIGFPVPKNPLDKNRSCGGSSGGSAGFTALTNLTHASIAESTGGSIACPASFCGVVGFTPTYGRVSRYGLIDYANSLDKIGTMGKSVEDAALLLEIIAGPDTKDSTSLQNAIGEYSNADSNIRGIKIGVVKELNEKCDESIRQVTGEAIMKLRKEEAEVVDVSLPLNSTYGMAAYYLISMSEASTNLARYCGMRYGLHQKLQGSFNQYFTRVRSSGFGKEAKRRILLGTFARMSGFRDAYYLKAMKVRTKLINEFKEVFKKVDLLVHPTMPIVAPKFDEIAKLTPLQNYAMDLCTIPANLAGLPHISVNAGSSKKMPVGLMLTADHLQEQKLVRAAKAVEEVVK